MDFDHSNYIGFGERYPKRNRRNKIEDLSSLEEPEYINKAEKLSSLPYDIEEMLNSPEYEHDFVESIPVEEFTLDYIKQTGLSKPHLFNVPPEALGMTMPNPETFTVDNVLECIGGQRKIEVVEVSEQSGRLMRLNDFISYYKKPEDERNELLNVLSLEFSNTKLAELVSAPAFVSKIDWIDTVWPKQLFARQQNLLKSASIKDHDFSTYPKVQRYCLMSVAKCFTDFHIDFGGTSVWYHILKGEKVFWIIKPTEENLKLYEEWILGGSSNTCFFGKIVNQCARINLKSGSTLIIPSGWIHCVYTPQDSLVFGGNFLHSLAIPMQIRVSRSEERIKIGNKYRFPHFKQIFWCYMAKIIQNVTGRIYQKPLTEEAHIIITTNNSFSAAENVSNEKTCCLNEDQPEIFQSQKQVNDEIMEENLKFYDDYGNAQDGTYTYNPIQLKFGDQNIENFKPVKNYNNDFLRSLSPFEINGFYSLLNYTKRLLKSKKTHSEVMEGITRPNHLIMEFEALLTHINELNLLNIQCQNVNFGPKITCTEFFVQHVIVHKHFEEVKMNLRLPPKRKSGKRALANSSFPNIDYKYSKKNSKRHSYPLVNGLPLPTLARQNDLVNQGSNINNEFIQLGHKPIPSAWRQFPNKTEQVFTPQISPFKRRMETNKLSESSTLQQISNQQQESCRHISSSNSLSEPFLSRQNSTDGKEEQKKTIKKRSKYLHTIPHLPKFVEMHDDSPELAYRSPLQRLSTVSAPQKDAYNVVTGISSNIRQSQRTKYTGHRDDENDKKFWRQRNNYCDKTVQETSYSFTQGWPYRSSYSNQRNSFESRDIFSFGNRTSLNEREANSFEQQSTSRSTLDGSSFNGMVTDAEINNREFARYNYEGTTNHRNDAAKDLPSSEHRTSQPISTTANELHQISQIMNHPEYVITSVDQIPLPPLPNSTTRQVKVTPYFMATTIQNDATINDEMPAGRVDPFTECDKLGDLAQMMSE